MKLKDVLSFPIVLFENIEPYNETISRGRCRIFYKGLNRNGSYISDEFAESLIKTLPYTPVKGIYEGEDYSDHGVERNEGRIYGVVPENPNLRWEEHIDEDGMTRTYAVTDVLLFTGLYEEARAILHQPQSMELYAPSVKGYWDVVEGRKCYRFTEGCFLGLQVLGKGVEPCFEGAEFFSLMDSLKELMDQLNEYSLKNNDIGGEKQMLLKLDNADPRFSAIYSLIATKSENEGEDDFINKSVYILSDEVVLVQNLEDLSIEFFTIKEEEGTYSLEPRDNIFVMNVSNTEKESLEAFKEKNNNTFDKAEEVFNRVETLEATVSTLEKDKTDLETKIVERDTQLSTLNKEKADLVEQFTQITNTAAALQSEVNTLKNYKQDTENQKKNGLIDTYSEKLDKEVLQKYRDDVSNYSFTDLQKELAFELIQSNPSLLSGASEGGYTPKDDNKGTTLTDILAKYKK